MVTSDKDADPVCQLQKVVELLPTPLTDEETEAQGPTAHQRGWS